MAEKDRIRCKEIRVKVSEDELKIAKDKAMYVGMNVSQFIRKIILDDNIKKIPVEDIISISEIINEYKYEINRIGNNVNQLVKVVHENNDLYAESQIKEVNTLLLAASTTFNEMNNIIYEKLYDLE